MSSLTIEPFQRHHRSAVSNLLALSPWAHAHLDWYRTNEWIEDGRGRIFVACEGQHLAGVMGLSQPLNGIVWLRLGGVSPQNDPADTLTQLWAYVQPLLQADGIEQAMVLVVSNWLEKHLPALGFRYHEDVITLFRTGLLHTKAPTTSATVRIAQPEELAELVRIDHSAFDPPWQMSASELRQAFRIAAAATLALVDGQPVGYQISTRQFINGHLARLAVLPALQGQGIGGALVHDLINRFDQRGVRTLTVNTQSSNLASQRVYARYEFRRNGFDLPVWGQPVAPASG